MMTERLFDTDAYLTRFTARVLACRPHGDGYATLLDRTCFCPRGGGQEGDTGRLGGVAVTATQSEGDGILHLTAAPLTVGAQVEGEIDMDARFDRMQNHTGEHIVSGLVHRLFGLNNVGFHLGAADTTLDFDGPLDRAALDRVEELANRAIEENLPVTAKIYKTAAEAAAVDFRSKRDFSENIRVVTVPGYDDCACCAPHVARTGEIGIIKLLDFIRYKGGVRIVMRCGRRALADYRMRYGRLSEISRLTSVPAEEAAAGVARLLDEIAALRGETVALARELIDARLSALPADRSEENLCFFESLLEEGGMRRLALGGAARTSGVCAVLSGDDAGGYRYCIAAEGRPLRQAAKELNAALSGRGGGRDEMISGTLCATRAAIVAFLATWRP